MPYDTTYMQNLKYDTNDAETESVKQKQNLRHREQTGGCQGGEGWRRDGGEVGVSRGKLLYIEWKSNKVLTHSTEKYSQYPMLNHNEKEYKKELDICITESFCCIATIDTILYVNLKNADSAFPPSS